jgi:hypothetical protein
MPTLRAVAMLQQYRQTPIAASFIDSEFFLDLRALSFTWYDSLQLPDSDTITYVVVARMQKYTNKKHTRAEVFLPLFNEVLRNLDAYWFFAWAQRTSLANVTLVDDLFVQRYPQVIDASVTVPLTHNEGYPPDFAGTPANRDGRYSNHLPVSIDPASSRASSPRDMPRQGNSTNTTAVSGPRTKSSTIAAPASGGVRRTSPRFRN